MKKRFVASCIGMAFMYVAVLSAQGASIELADYAFNINGTISQGSIPGGVDDSAFDFTTGLGTLEIIINGAGSYHVAAFFDHEIDQTVNTFFNEYGATHGTPAVGQSWEIDEPGWVFGDIYNNFVAGSLDNANGVPSSAPDDVSMAMGWNFSLSAGEQAVISMILSESVPAENFFLFQTDPDSPATLYFSSTLERRGITVPDICSTSTLLSCVIAVFCGLRRYWK